MTILVLLENHIPSTIWKVCTIARIASLIALWTISFFFLEGIFMMAAISDRTLVPITTLYSLVVAWACYKLILWEIKYVEW